jgi:hypothetical protein
MHVRILHRSEERQQDAIPYVFAHHTYRKVTDPAKPHIGACTLIISSFSHSAMSPACDHIPSGYRHHCGAAPSYGGLLRVMTATLPRRRAAVTHHPEGPAAATYHLWSNAF